MIAIATIKTKTVSRLTEADLLAKGHTHIVAGSLTYDAVANKQRITINTFGADGLPDGNTREIATSDLFQCRTTVETKEAMDKAKRSVKGKAKRAAVKALLAASPENSDSEPVVILDERAADVEALLAV